MINRDWLETASLPELMAASVAKRDATYGRLVSYSPKVFIPLTKLCRDVCHYCTFAERPRAGHAAYLSADEVLAIAKAGQDAGCTDSRCEHGFQAGPAFHFLSFGSPPLTDKVASPLLRTA